MDGGREAPGCVAKSWTEERRGAERGGGPGGLSDAGGGGVGNRWMAAPYQLAQSLSVHDELWGETVVIWRRLVGRRGVFHPLLHHDAMRLRQVRDVGGLRKEERSVCGVERGRSR